MQQGYFITGTDTGVGKTWAAIALMHYFRNQGKTVVGMKPVASGCCFQEGQWRNEDALLMQTHASVPLAYNLINPYAYEEPVSPHIAGQNNPVELNTVQSCFDVLQDRAEIMIVEGAGGWYTPINVQQSIADLARMLALPVVVVVAIRLGCINHAQLTVRAIEQAGLNCAGWIATCLDFSVLRSEETMQTLKLKLNASNLGILPYRPNADFNFFARQLRL